MTRLSSREDDNAANVEGAEPTTGGTGTRTA